MHSRKAAKRGGEAVQVTLNENQVHSATNPDLFEPDAALTMLAEHHPRKADVIELNDFGGLTQPAMPEF